MTDNMLPLGTDAQPQPVANDKSIDTGVEIRALQAENDKPEEPKPAEPKQLTAEEELEKLRRAKARDDRRIGKLTAQKYQAMKEAEELRNKYSSTQHTAQQGGELSPAKTGIPTKLDANKFANYAEFLEARSEEIADYKIEKKFAEREGKQQEERKTEKEQEWEAQRSDIVDKQASEFAKEHPEINALFDEYEDTIRDFPKEIKHALLAADNAPLAFFNLAKEGKLEDLAQMSLVDAKVEIRLAQLKQPEKAKTKAPAPLPASRGSVPSGKDPSQMTDAEFNAWRRASISKKR